MFNSVMPANLIQNGISLNVNHANQNDSPPTPPESTTSCEPTQLNGYKILLDLDPNTILYKSLNNLLKSSFFDKKQVNWQPVKFELVVNNKLMQEFEQIKNEFKSNAKQELEYEENYAYLIENESLVEEICHNGYQCQDNSYNVIGHSKSGVYVCKYPDVSLRYNYLKKSTDSNCFKMIIFKILYGQQTLALVRKDAKLSPIPATINFNSHMSVIPPKEKDDIEIQFDHSQIYLYEHDLNSKIPIKKPRNCLPYAVVTWIKNESVEWPISFEDLEEIPIKNVLNGHEEKKELLAEEKKEEKREKEEEEEETKNTNEEKLEDNSSNKLNLEKTQEEEEKLVEKKKEEEEPQNMDCANNKKELEEKDQIKLVSQSSNETLNAQTNITSTVTPNSITSSTTPNGTVVNKPNQTTTPSSTPTPTNSVYPKPSAYSAYRQNAAALSPYLLAQQFSPFGAAAAIRLPFAHGAQPIQAVPQTVPYQALNQHFQTAPTINPAAQQVFLCRGPNGLTYVTAAAPNVVQQQLAVAQAQAQAQANAILQQQAAVLSAQVQQQQQQLAAAAGLQYQKYQATNPAALAGYIQQHQHQQHQQTQHQQQQTAVQTNQTQPQQQIIYQAAPQPASSAKSQAQSQTNGSTTPAPTHSPKQQTNPQPAQSVVQTGLLPQLAGYHTSSVPATQQHLLAYANNMQNQLTAINPQAALATQQGYMLAAAQGGPQSAALLAQQQQLQQLQQLQQQQQQQQQVQQQQAANQQLYAAGAAYPQLTPGLQQAQTQSVGLAQLPGGGYQLIDYRQLGVTAAGIPLQLDQLGLGIGAVPRPRIVNLRHHPYQRP